MVNSIERNPTVPCCAPPKVGDDQGEHGKHQRHGEHPAVADAIPEFLAGDVPICANSMPASQSKSRRTRLRGRARAPAGRAAAARVARAEHGHLGFAADTAPKRRHRALRWCDRQVASAVRTVSKCSAGNPHIEPQRQVHLLAQGLHGAHGPDSALGHDGEPVNPLLDLGQDVGGQHHRHAFRSEPTQDRVELADGFGVQAGGRLVEKQDLWSAEQGLGKTEALAHAFGIFAHAPFGRVGQSDAVQGRGAFLQGAPSAAKNCRVSSPVRLS
jgi:hypothetical protein